MHRILGVYGLIVSILIQRGIVLEEGSDGSGSSYSLTTGYVHLATGLVLGLTSLSAGIAIGVAGDASVRAFVQQTQIYSQLILLMIFCEAIALYGAIIAVVLITSALWFGQRGRGEREEC